MTTATAVTPQRAAPDMAPLLRNLLGLCARDPSEIFPVEVGPDGRFGYDELALAIRTRSPSWRSHADAGATRGRS